LRGLIAHDAFVVAGSVVSFRIPIQILIPTTMRVVKVVFHAQVVTKLVGKESSTSSIVELATEQGSDKS